MPFAFSMKHYQVFGDTTPRMKDKELLSPESWDVLRQGHPFFSIPETRKEWVKVSELSVTKDGQDKDLAARARDIAALIEKHRFSRVFSVGVGGAALEYQLIKLMPALPLICSDYSAKTVETLKKVFIEADDVIKFDILKAGWKEEKQRYLGDNGLLIMYRIDASFSDGEWRELFERLSAAGIRNVLVIPTGMLTILSVYNRKSREVKWFLNGTPLVWSGYVRTKRRFQEFWHSLYTEEMHTLGGLKSFLLTTKRAREMSKSDLNISERALGARVSLTKK
jgi:hypothetical protein